MDCIDSRALVFILSNVVLLSACSIGSDRQGRASDDDGEPVSQVQQPFTGFAGLSVTNGSASTPVSAGTATFMNMVSGNFAAGTLGGAYVLSAFGGSYTIFEVDASPGVPGASVSVGGSAVYPGVSGTPHPSAACLSNIGSGHPSDTHSIVHTAVTSPFRCFLYEMDNFTEDSWSSFTDQARITYNHGEPVLTCSNNAEAAATCVSITTYYGSASWNGTTPLDLGPADAGKVCGITGVYGSFRSNSDGVTVFIDPYDGMTPHHWWVASYTGAQGAFVDCVK